MHARSSSSVGRQLSRGVSCQVRPVAGDHLQPNLENSANGALACGETGMADVRVKLEASHFSQTEFQVDNVNEKDNSNVGA